MIGIVRCQVRQQGFVVDKFKLRHDSGLLPSLDLGLGQLLPRILQRDITFCDHSPCLPTLLSVAPLHPSQKRVIL